MWPHPIHRYNLFNNNELKKNAFEKVIQECKNMERRLE